MNAHSPTPAVDATLAFHVAGFVVRGQGYWTEESLRQFRHFLAQRRIEPADATLAAALAQAQAEYHAASKQLYLCAGLPCRRRTLFDTDAARLAELSRRSGVTIVKTGCQGPCKRAPVMSFKLDDRSDAYAEVASEQDWQRVLDYAATAARAGTLLVDGSAIEGFRYDPVHDHERPGVHLQPLGFLLGRFRGEGRYAMSDYVFRKEMHGSFEAGGRFIALKMDACYPLADGRLDVHKALVVVGAGPGGGIRAHAYTDGGLVRDYTVDAADGRLGFADLPPGHGDDWVRARKILQPTDFGFEERLEVDDGSGVFQPYYHVAMRRVIEA
ncbi:MAG TPA: (2Fe-2S) ferredoxin domain-containing protein [Gammaproteobacteria bacterium]|nr:(2Fe-2S) ferredoxin domain-containing protein [Gammaproteobacteria bacterium]